MLKASSSAECCKLCQGSANCKTAVWAESNNNCYTKISKNSPVSKPGLKITACDFGPSPTPAPPLPTPPPTPILALAFASVFTGGAVLQSDVEFAIWGTATKATSVELHLDGKRIANNVPVSNGKWKTYLPAQITSWSSILTVAGGGTTHSVAVKFGQVVLCSGQV